MGVVVNKLALHINGLGEEEDDVTGMQETAVGLMRDLGIRTVDSETMMIDKAAPPTVEELGKSIDRIMTEQGLSIRNVAKMTDDVSHNGVDGARKGKASLQLTRKVAEALGVRID